MTPRPDAGGHVVHHRIDMVFARGTGTATVQADRGVVVGNELSDRDPATGLWPSDHAGVVVRLRGLR